MEQNTFLNAYFEQETEIERIAQSAAELHRSVAQTYGGYLPYEFHLRLTAAHVTRFGHLAGCKVTLDIVLEPIVRNLHILIYFLLIFRNATKRPVTDHRLPICKDRIFYESFPFLKTVCLVHLMQWCTRRRARHTTAALPSGTPINGNPL